MMMSKNNITSNASVILLVIVVIMSCFVSSLSLAPQGNCAHIGEICGLKPCCEGLLCEGMKGCQLPCAKLGEMCGIKRCCEGLLCEGMKGCQLPLIVANDILNDM